MSTKVEVTIRCDDPFCPETISFEERNKGGLNVSTAISSAVDRYGWQATTKTAYCPKHRKPARGAHAFVPGGWTGHEPSRCSVVVGNYGHVDQPKVCGKPTGHAVHIVPAA